MYQLYQFTFLTPPPFYFLLPLPFILYCLYDFPFSFPPYNPFLITIPTTEANQSINTLIHTQTNEQIISNNNHNANTPFTQTPLYIQSPRPLTHLSCVLLSVTRFLNEDHQPLPAEGVHHSDTLALLATTSPGLPFAKPLSHTTLAPQVPRPPS